MISINTFLQQVRGRQDFVLAIMLMSAIFMMVLPLPTEIIDILVSFNLAQSIILLMIVIYIDNPLEFSVFPSLLLLTTLFRLALTISTSRLILLQHDAGHIIYTFGNFVVAGNLIVGLIVFLIISVVQFIVITKGAERVAEVSARFSLDGMPGKQMSIDGDLRAGVIDAEEAKFLRAQVQKESKLYGAMDGAMKFVKGDTIASLIVILINLIGGLCVGIFVHGMDAADALNTYSILSIGDGLADQIPGLLISITAGIIVTRVPEDDKQNLAKTVISQMTSKPLALLVAAFLIIVFSLIPGFPFIDFFVIACITVALILFSTQGKRWLKNIRNKEEDLDESIEDKQVFTGVHPLSIDAGINTTSKKRLKEKINSWTKERSQLIGFPLPEAKLSVYSTGSNTNKISILLYGTPVLEETFSVDESLSLLSESQLQKKNITFRKKKTLVENFSLFWVKKTDLSEFDETIKSKRQTASGEDIIIYLLEKIIDRYAKEFIGIQETSYIIDSVESKFTELVKEVQRQLSISQIAEVFQRLVAESVSLQNLRTIFEALAEWSHKEKDILLLTEYVRIALQRYLTYTYSHGKSEISAFVTSEKTEQTIREAIRQTDLGSYLALTPAQAESLIKKISQLIATTEYENEPVFLTSMDVRRYLRKLLESKFYDIPVISYQELSKNIKITVLATL